MATQLRIADCANGYMVTVHDDDGRDLPRLYAILHGETQQHNPVEKCFVFRSLEDALVFAGRFFELKNGAKAAFVVPEDEYARDANPILSLGQLNQIRSCLGRVK